MRLFLFSARARSPLSALLPPSLIFDHTATHACPPAPACPRCYRVDLMMVLAQHHPSKPNATAHRSQTAARARKARRLLPVPHRPIGVGRGCALRSFYASPNLRIQLHSARAPSASGSRRVGPERKNFIVMAHAISSSRTLWQSGCYEEAYRAQPQPQPRPTMESGTGM